jgi:hypothetical protein
MGGSEGTLLRITSVVFLVHDDRRQVGQAKLPEVDQGESDPVRLSDVAFRAYGTVLGLKFRHLAGSGVSA